MSSVLQPWVMELPHMQQGVLLGSVRGPDGLPKEHPAKLVLRWYRRCILFSAYMNGRALTDPWTPDRGGSFTGPWPEDLNFDKMLKLFLRTLDEQNTHFLMHLLHGSEILGYKHPNPQIRGEWHGFYLQVVDALHLLPESEEVLDKRLGQ